MGLSEALARQYDSVTQLGALLEAPLEPGSEAFAAGADGRYFVPLPIGRVPIMPRAPGAALSSPASSSVSALARLAAATFLPPLEQQQATLPGSGQEVMMLQQQLMQQESYAGSEALSRLSSGAGEFVTTPIW